MTRTLARTWTLDLLAIAAACCLVGGAVMGAVLGG